MYNIEHEVVIEFKFKKKSRSALPEYNKYIIKYQFEILVKSKHLSDADNTDMVPDIIIHHSDFMSERALCKRKNACFYCFK